MKYKKIVGQKKVKRKKGKTKHYFTMDTQNKIIEFQKSDDEEEKHAIYKEHILPAFDKLVENLIFIYGFMRNNDSYQEIKDDCISALYIALPKYKSETGFLAFSYFNIVARNHLTIENRKKANRTKRHTNIDEMDSMSLAEQESFIDFCTIDSLDDQTIKDEYIKSIRSIFIEIEERVKRESEVKIIKSLIHIFDNLDYIDFLNKRAVFKYIREITDLSPKQLTSNMSAIKKHYKVIRKEKLNESDRKLER